jgi:hypothetical protein
MLSVRQRQHWSVAMVNHLESSCLIQIKAAAAEIKAAKQRRALYNPASAGLVTSFRRYWRYDFKEFPLWVFPFSSVSANPHAFCCWLR